MKNKLFNSIFGLIAVVFVNLSFVLTGGAQTLEQSAAQNCQGSGCNAMSRAELFIKTFGGSKALRTSQLEQEEQVRLAFYGIDATRVEIEQGRLTEPEGKFIIDGHEQVIRDYVHDKSNDAMVKAATGQVSDIPAITKTLGNLLSVARQDALLGREELAQAAQEKMVRVLTTFSQQFASTCEQQSFPVETAIILERQNQLLGTDISLSHCMNRKFSGTLSSQGVDYYIETCSDLINISRWKLEVTGRMIGEGEVVENGWNAAVTFRGREYHRTGEFEMFTELAADEKENPVNVPNDAGPKAKSNGWASAPLPQPFQYPRKIPLYKFRMSLMTIEYRDQLGVSNKKMVAAELKTDDKPCNPLTDDLK